MKGPHKDWWKPIHFKRSSKDFAVDDDWERCDMIAYGLPNWINRCEWIVPGTLGFDL